MEGGEIFNILFNMRGGGGGREGSLVEGSSRPVWKMAKGGV